MADLIDPRAKNSELIAIKWSRYSRITKKKYFLGRDNFIADRMDSLGASDAIPSIIIRNSEHLTRHAWICYAKYLKNGQIPSIDSCDVDDNGVVHRISITFEQFIDFYLFAAKVGEVELQNDVMDALLAKLKDTCDGNEDKPWLPSNSVITKVYKYTYQGSPLRKFLVDIHIWANSVGERSDRRHEAFLRELFFATWKRQAISVEDIYYSTIKALMAKEQAQQSSILVVSASAGKAQPVAPVKIPDNVQLLRLPQARTPCLVWQ